MASTCRSKRLSPTSRASRSSASTSTLQLKPLALLRNVGHTSSLSATTSLAAALQTFSTCSVSPASCSLCHRFSRAARLSCAAFTAVLAAGTLLVAGAYPDRPSPSSPGGSPCWNPGLARASSPLLPWWLPTCGLTPALAATAPTWDWPPTPRPSSRVRSRADTARRTSGSWRPWPSWKRSVSLRPSGRLLSRWLSTSTTRTSSTVSVPAAHATHSRRSCFGRSLGSASPTTSLYTPCVSRPLTMFLPTFFPVASSVASSSPFRRRTASCPSARDTSTSRPTPSHLRIQRGDHFGGGYLALERPCAQHSRPCWRYRHRFPNLLRLALWCQHRLSARHRCPAPRVAWQHVLHRPFIPLRQARARPPPLPPRRPRRQPGRL